MGKKVLHDQTVVDAFNNVYGRPPTPEEIEQWKTAAPNIEELQSILAVTPEARRRGVDPTMFGNYYITDPSGLTKDQREFYDIWNKFAKGRPLDWYTIKIWNKFGSPERLQRNLLADTVKTADGRTVEIFTEEDVPFLLDEKGMIDLDRYFHKGDLFMLPRGIILPDDPEDNPIKTQQGTGPLADFLIVQRLPRAHHGFFGSAIEFAGDITGLDSFSHSLAKQVEKGIGDVAGAVTVAINAAAVALPILQPVALTVDLFGDEVVGLAAGAEGQSQLIDRVHKISGISKTDVQNIYGYGDAATDVVLDVTATVLAFMGQGVAAAAVYGASVVHKGLNEMQKEATGISNDVNWGAFAAERVVEGILLWAGFEAAKSIKAVKAVDAAVKAGKAADMAAKLGMTVEEVTAIAFSAPEMIHSLQVGRAIVTAEGVVAKAAASGKSMDWEKIGLEAGVGFALDIAGIHAEEIVSAKKAALSSAFMSGQISIDEATRVGKYWDIAYKAYKYAAPGVGKLATGSSWQVAALTSLGALAGDAAADVAGGTDSILGMVSRAAVDASFAGMIAQYEGADANSLGAIVAQASASSMTGSIVSTISSGGHFGGKKIVRIPTEAEMVRSWGAAAPLTMEEIKRRNPALIKPVDTAIPTGYTGASGVGTPIQQNVSAKFSEPSGPLAAPAGPPSQAKMGLPVPEAVPESTVIGAFSAPRSGVLKTQYTTGRAMIAPVVVDFDVATLMTPSEVSTKSLETSWTSGFTTPTQFAVNQKSLGQYAKGMNMTLDDWARVA